VNEGENIIVSTDVLRTLRQVSLIFFLLIGTSHLLSSLFVSNNILLPASNIVNRILDIPFAMIATIFGLSQAKIASNSKGLKLYYILMVVISLLVLGLLLYINLLLADKVA
jgi:hypothetical protein